MDAPTLKTKNEEHARVTKIMEDTDKALLLGLQGDPLLDGDGNPVFENGKLVRKAPSASIIKAALVRCKDAGVSRPLSESDPLDEMAELAEAAAKRSGVLPPVDFLAEVG